MLKKKLRRDFYETMTQFKPASDSEQRIVEELLSAILITDGRVSITNGAPIICRVARDGVCQPGVE